MDEIAILLDEAESGEKLTERQKIYHNKTKKRDMAILTLLLGTGIRVSECEMCIRDRASGLQMSIFIL